jgi:6-pyruvoyltetrahydropterin/6-carboxytetrahydropterin synthase
MIIGKEFTFDAAHRLANSEKDEEWNLQCFGECYQLHGHTYRLRVEISGFSDDDAGMILNFKELSEVVRSNIISQVDHKELNRVEMLRRRLPTAENMVSTFWEVLDPIFLGMRVSLESITLWETATSYARRSR